jgi:hypothetical protein
MRRLSSILALTLLLLGASNAQLPKEWLGIWKGMMYMYNSGTLRDSVMVMFTVKPSAQEGSYTWRTDYHSAKTPVTKDYTLRVRDAAKGLYVTDEGDGIELTSYLVGNKIYSLFEVQNTMLSASYELRGDDLVFEVTSGKKEPLTGGGVTTFSVKNLQRIVFKRIPVD